MAAQRHLLGRVWQHQAALKPEAEPRVPITVADLPERLCVVALVDDALAEVKPGSKAGQGWRSVARTI